MRRKHRHITIIGQQRPFDEERWRELLTAFAYVLHEQRQAEATLGTANGADDGEATHDHRTHHAAHLPVVHAGEGS